MKIIQALIVLFAIIGCLALALGGFFIYSMTQSDGDNFLTRFKKARATRTENTQTTAPVVAKDSEYASIIRQYQPTPTPTPVGAPPQPGAVVMPVAPATPTSKPIKTPAPDEGKIRSWPSGKKWVALTYDDGPHREWTGKLMELLKSKNVKATFFLLGQEIERYPDIAKSIADNGFEIGNHTMTHANFYDLSADEIREELEKTNALIAEHVTQKPVRVMRPPFGNTPDKAVEICADLGLSIVCWNIDTNDWKSGITAEEMTENVMKNIKDGAIILMHDKHQKTYDTTAAVIDKIRAEGYEFVTMSEMLGFTQQAPQSVVAPPPVAAPAMAPAPLPAPPAARAGAPAANATLPVPAAAQSTQAPTVETLDASKITVPPS